MVAPFSLKIENHICRLDKTALVLCDVMEDGSHELAPHAPRSILTKQLQAAKEVGAFVPMAASELEYFLYQETYEESKDKGYANLKPAGWVREDYHILQGTRGEYFHGMVILFLLLQ
jgi:glutamine synthetase